MAQVRAEYSYNRMQVLWLTNMDDGMLRQFQFDTGLQWLTTYTADDEDILRWILNQPLVWKWWINEWNRRDEQYLPILYKQHMRQREETVFIYRSLHQSCFIAQSVPWTLLEDGYCKVIAEIK